MPQAEGGSARRAKTKTARREVRRRVRSRVSWQWPIFRRGLPPQYRRRCGVSLPCSGWERVVPPRSNHQLTENRNTEAVAVRVSPASHHGPASQVTLGSDRRLRSERAHATQGLKARNTLVGRDWTKSRTGVRSLVTPSDGMGIVYVRIASRSSTSIDSTKLRISALRSGILPSAKNSRKSGDVFADLRRGRQVGPALLQLTRRVFVRCCELILALAELEDARRERLHCQVSRFQRLIESVEPAADISQFGLDRV